MSPGIKRENRGFSPVLASIILAAVVLTIGGAVWAVTQSATSVMANSYYREVNASINRIMERFTVEHITFDNSTGENLLRIWIYNYGNISIEVKYVYVEGDATGENTTGLQLPSGGLLEVIVALTDVQVGDELAIEVVSGRSNIIYDDYVVPS